MNKRIQTVQKQLQYDAALIENPIDLYYLTGLDLSCGLLIIAKDKVCLFVDGRYFAAAEKKGICSVRLFEKQAVIEWIAGQSIQTCEYDSAFTVVDRFEFLKNLLKNVKFFGTSGVLKKQRAIKDQKEIDLLKKAQEITYQGFLHVEKSLRVGISEEELALEFEIFVRKKGASSLSFSPIIAFGEHSAYPHYRAGNVKLKKDQVILIDVGAVFDHYAGDLTRVLFFGRKDPKIDQMLKLTQKAQKAAIDAVKPGIRVGKLDEIAREVFAKEGMEELFIHGLGHGIGLETHEFFSVKKLGADADVELEPGMVFTIEPGLYLPGVGGVRWEDVIQVTETGHVVFKS